MSTLATADAVPNHNPVSTVSCRVPISGRPHGTQAVSDTACQSTEVAATDQRSSPNAVDAKAKAIPVADLKGEVAIESHANEAVASLQSAQATGMVTPPPTQRSFSRAHLSPHKFASSKKRKRPEESTATTDPDPAADRIREGSDPVDAHSHPSPSKRSKQKDDPTGRLDGGDGACKEPEKVEGSSKEAHESKEALNGEGSGEGGGESVTGGVTTFSRRSSRSPRSPRSPRGRSSSPAPSVSTHDGDGEPSPSGGAIKHAGAERKFAHVAKPRATTRQHASRRQILSTRQTRPLGDSSHGPGGDDTAALEELVRKLTARRAPAALDVHGGGRKHGVPMLPIPLLPNDRVLFGHEGRIYEGRAQMVSAHHVRMVVACPRFTPPGRTHGRGDARAGQREPPPRPGIVNLEFKLVNTLGRVDFEMYTLSRARRFDASIAPRVTTQSPRPTAVVQGDYVGASPELRALWLQPGDVFELVMQGGRVFDAPSTTLAANGRTSSPHGTASQRGAPSSHGARFDDTAARSAVGSSEAEMSPPLCVATVNCVTETDAFVQCCPHPYASGPAQNNRSDDAAAHMNYWVPRNTLRFSRYLARAPIGPPAQLHFECALPAAIAPHAVTHQTTPSRVPA